MAKFVIAGRADCQGFARAEMLADTLRSMLPDFSVHKLVQSPEEWPVWLEEQCTSNGWHHSSSPLVWRELLDRGGKGMYLGGLAEFQDYAQHYYSVSPSTDPAVEEKIASENLESLTSLRLDQQNSPLPVPLRVCITNATSESAYHLVFLVATGRVFGGDTLVKLHLLDSPENQSQLKGVAMELMDLASPILAGVVCTSSAQEAFNSVSAAFILADYPHVGGEEEKEGRNGKLEMRESEQRGVEEGDGKNQRSKTEGTTNPLLIQASLLYHRYAGIMDFCSQKDVRVIVSGPLANTGAAIMAKSVSSIPKENFVASSSLPEQQACSILAERLKLNTADVQQVAVWGRTEGEDLIIDTSHSCIRHFQGAVVGPDHFSLPLSKCVFDCEWLGVEFPQLLAARHGRREGYREGPGGRSVALSEAVGLAGLMGDWFKGEEKESNGIWRSLGVVSCGDYSVPEGVVFSVPTHCQGGRWEAVKGLNIPPDVQVRITHQAKVLQDELMDALGAIEEQQQQTSKL